MSYLFNRRDWADVDQQSAASLATHIFFQMWQVRSNPYNKFSDDDTVYIGDTQQRRVFWEVRPTHIISNFHYTSTADVLDALLNCYGFEEDDLNEYHRNRPTRGWVLAWSPSVIRQLDLAIPDGMKFGQNGYRELARADLNELHVPRAPVRQPLASPPPWYDTAAAGSGTVRQVPRYIPVHVRQAVSKRDGNHCVGCGTTVNLHFDHILPWTHGGPSTEENLRLLCARSNLARGAGQVDGQLLCMRAAAKPGDHTQLPLRPQ